MTFTLIISVLPKIALQSQETAPIKLSNKWVWYKCSDDSGLAQVFSTGAT